MNIYLILFVFSTTLGCNSNNKEIPAQKFDSKKWKKATNEQRGSMVRNLLGFDNSVKLHKLHKVKLTKKSILFGKKKAELLKLLGNPDGESSEGPDSVEKWDSEMSYRVGFFGKGKAFRTEYQLAIYFDKNGSLGSLLGVNKDGIQNCV